MTLDPDDGCKFLCLAMHDIYNTLKTAAQNRKDAFDTMRELREHYKLFHVDNHPPVWLFDLAREVYRKHRPKE